MWSFVVALPAVQADFGIARGEASLPFTLTMFGFGIGGIVMGRLADRFGIVTPLILGALLLGIGYALSSFANGIGTLALAQGLIGLGSSATFGPLMTDVSRWFGRRRGIASVAVASCGTISSGTLWPPIIQHFIAIDGWRTDPGLASASSASSTSWCRSVLLLLRRLPPPSRHSRGLRAPTPPASSAPSAFRRTRCMALVVRSPALRAALPWRCRRSISSPIAATSVAAPARGARDAVDDAGLRPDQPRHRRLLSPTASAASRRCWLSSLLQGVALLLYVFFDGLFSLYVISALLGSVPGQHRADATPSSYGNILRRRRPARGSASSCRQRSAAAWRSAAGCPA